MVYDSVDDFMIAKDRFTLRPDPSNNAMPSFWQTSDRPSEMQHQALESEAYPQNWQQRGGCIQLPHISDQTNIFWISRVAGTGTSDHGREWLQKDWEIRNLIVDVDDCDFDTELRLEEGYDIVCKGIVGVDE